MEKKIICMLLALSMMLTVLAACNNEPVVDETPDDGQQQEDIQPNTPDNEVEEPFDGTLKLVVDGVSDYVIVRGENAYISEVTASTELQKYLKQISGVEIPIVTDATPAVEKEIVVGKTNREADGEFNRDELGDDGLVIKSNGQKLFLVGGEQRGTLYAVYEFLESYLGCRFYTKSVEKIPELTTISLEKIEENKQIPTVMFRELGWRDWDNASFCVKRKINSTWSTTLTEDLGGEENWTGGHSMSWLVSVDQYYAEHPEYFAMQENGERASSGRGGPQVCLSNPEVINILIENVRNWIKSTPGVRIFHIGQNDNDDFCRCDECVKIYNEEGGALSGTMIRAVNAVAEALADEFPDIIFQTYAYGHTRSAPITKTADNVMIMLCNIERCVSHRVDADCAGMSKVTFIDGSNKSFKEDLEDWKEVADKIYIYEYNMNWMDHQITMPEFHNLYNDTQYYVYNNAVGMLSQGKTTGYCCEFGELRTYLRSKLYWDPYMTEEEYWEHYRDFLSGVYGPGWEYLHEYLELAETLSESQHFAYNDDVVRYYPLEVVNVHEKDSYPEELTVDMIKNYETVDWNKYWNWYKTVNESELTVKGAELFAKAIEMAETDSQRTQLDKISIQIDYMKAYYYYENYRVGNNSIGKIVGYFMQDHPEAFTTDEILSYRKNIIKFANEHSGVDYENYNRALIEKMKKYTNVYQESGYLSDSDSFNLKNPPSDWLD